MGWGVGGGGGEARWTSRVQQSWRSRNHFWQSHRSDLEINTLVASHPTAWRYKVIARTGWPDVSIL